MDELPVEMWYVCTLVAGRDKICMIVRIAKWSVLGLVPLIHRPLRSCVGVGVGVGGSRVDAESWAVALLWLCNKRVQDGYVSGFGVPVFFTLPHPVYDSWYVEQSKDRYLSKLLLCVLWFTWVQHRPNSVCHFVSSNMSDLFSS